MPTWVLIILAVFFVGLVINVVLYFIQDKILFHPETISKNYEFNFSNDFEEIFLETLDGASLNGVLFKLNNPKGVVLYFHNHSGNVKHCSNAVHVFNELNYDVLVMDYRGFGKSTGVFNEVLMSADSQLWYDYVMNRYDEDKIALYGRGIGATFATYVASRNNPKILCLESPLYNLFYTAKFHYPYVPRKIISKYEFNTAKYFTTVSCMKYIFHGKQDDLVHYTNSQKLYDLSKKNSKLILISEANHYNLGSNNFYLQKIEQLFNA